MPGHDRMWRKQYHRKQTKETMEERMLVSGCEGEVNGYNTQLLYFTCSSLSSDDQRLYVISDRDGHPNVYVRYLQVA